MNLLFAGSDWSWLPNHILSQVFDAVRAGPSVTARAFCEVCKSWCKFCLLASAHWLLSKHAKALCLRGGHCKTAFVLSNTLPVKNYVHYVGECPTAWITRPQNAPLRPHRFLCLVHLTQLGQAFGYQEAIAISQLPSLRTLHLINSTTVSAFSEAAPDGYMLPAPCMLTHLTSLSLVRVVSANDLKGISLLTNLHSFSWKACAEDLPWGLISCLLSLKCLTVASPNLNLLLPAAGMTGLKVLDVAGNPGEGCWNTLNSLKAVNSITKLTCRDGAFFASPVFTSLQHFTDLQHLAVSLYGPCIDVWEKLAMVTWIKKLDIGRVWVINPSDWGYASLLSTLTTMTQLTSLRLSNMVDIRMERAATRALAEMNRLSRLVCLKELNIECHLRPSLLSCSAKLQSSLQMHLTDAEVHVTPQEYKDL